MNAFDPALFAADIGCLPCCTAPAECACALEIPAIVDTVSSPFVDYATAAAAIAAQVSNCIGYVLWDGVNLLTSFTADNTTPDQLILTTVGNPEGAPTCVARTWASINLKAGSTLTINASAAGGLDSATSDLYSCDGTLLDTQIGATQNFAITTDGEYLIFCYVGSIVDGFGGGSDTMVADLTCDDTMTVNPVIALWDDSGTTRQLEACPKFYAPALTEATGDWYADCATAEIIANDWCSNCVAWQNQGGTPGNQVSDGGTSLDYSDPSSPAGVLPWWSSVNAVAGDFLTLAWSISSGTPPNGLFDIYDYSGTLIESMSSTTSPLISAALPYTGRYIIMVRIYNSFPDLCDNISGSVTSSGVMSINQVQVLYDPAAGITCPGRLNCGDSC